MRSYLTHSAPGGNRKRPLLNIRAELTLVKGHRGAEHRKAGAKKGEDPLVLRALIIVNSFQSKKLLFVLINLFSNTFYPNYERLSSPLALRYINQ